MRGDISASELQHQQNRQFLLRVGLGMYDVPSGMFGGIGFEDVYKYAYVANEQQDLKLYRRKVFQLVGKYYPNELAVQLWQEFENYQLRLQTEKQQSVDLPTAARLWLEHYGHDYFKNWALECNSETYRWRNCPEPRLNWFDSALIKAVPRWGLLRSVGFKSHKLLVAEVKSLAKPRHLRRLFLLGYLSNEPVNTTEEAHRRLAEIEMFQANLQKVSATKVEWLHAAIEYHQRLSLLAELEGRNTDSGTATGNFQFA